MNHVERRNEKQKFLAPETDTRTDLTCPEAGIARVYACTPGDFVYERLIASSLGGLGLFCLPAKRAVRPRSTLALHSTPRDRADGAKRERERGRAIGLDEDRRRLVPHGAGKERDLAGGGGLCSYGRCRLEDNDGRNELVAVGCLDDGFHLPTSSVYLIGTRGHFGHFV